MTFIQALRHFATFAYGWHLSREQANIDRLFALSSPIYRLELAMVGRLCLPRIPSSCRHRHCRRPRTWR